MKFITSLLTLLVACSAFGQERGAPPKASQAQVNAGTDNFRFLTAATVSGLFSNEFGVINVDQFGAKHSARNVVGNVTSNSTAVALTIGTVSSSDVGAFVRIGLGTSTNRDLVTTISAVTDSNHFSLTRAVSNTITGAEICLATNDDSGAIQAAINVWATNGGIVALQSGSYWVTNLTIPIVGNGGNQYGRTLTIQGKNAPVIVGFAGGHFIVPSSQTVLVYGHETGLGTNDAVIKTPAGAGWSGQRIELANFSIRLPSNPNVHGVDIGTANTTFIHDMVIDTGYAEYDPRTPQPLFTNQFGIKFPGNGNYGGGTLYTDRVLIGGGIYNGIYASDHFAAGTISFYNCVNALVMGSMSDGLITHLDAEGCDHVLASDWFTGLPSYGMICSLWYENTQAGWWHGNTLIYDPLSNVNQLYWTINGGGNLSPVVTNYIGYLGTTGGNSTNFGGCTVTYVPTFAAGVRPETYFGNVHHFGNLSIDPTAIASGYSQLRNDGVNKGMFFTPKGTDSTIYSLWISSRSDIGNAAARQFHIDVDAAAQRVYLVAAASSGGGYGPMPIDFCTTDYGGRKVALTVETNGSLTVKGTLSVIATTNAAPAAFGDFKGGMWITNNGAAFRVPIY